MNEFLTRIKITFSRKQLSGRQVQVPSLFVGQLFDPSQVFKVCGFHLLLSGHSNSTKGWNYRTTKVKIVSVKQHTFCSLLRNMHQRLIISELQCIHQICVVFLWESPVRKLMMLVYRKGFYQMCVVYVESHSPGKEL